MYNIFKNFYNEQKKLDRFQKLYLADAENNINLDFKSKVLLKALKTEFDFNDSALLMVSEFIEYDAGDCFHSLCCFAYDGFYTIRRKNSMPSTDLLGFFKWSDITETEIFEEDNWFRLKLNFHDGTLNSASIINKRFGTITHEGLLAIKKLIDFTIAFVTSLEKMILASVKESNFDTASLLLTTYAKVYLGKMNTDLSTLNFFNTQNAIIVQNQNVKIYQLEQSLKNLKAKVESVFVD